jgi:hypothetical protein
MPTAPKPPPGLSRTEFRRWYQTVYCESEYWIWLRQLALDWWEHQCGTCGATEQLQVHHLRYANLGRERREDMAVLCRSCHDAWHARKKAREFNAWRTVAIEGMAARRIADDEASEEARTRAEYDAAGWWNQQVADSRDEE